MGKLKNFLYDLSIENSLNVEYDYTPILTFLIKIKKISVSTEGAEQMIIKCVEDDPVSRYIFRIIHNFSD